MEGQGGGLTELSLRCREQGEPRREGHPQAAGCGSASPRHKAPTPAAPRVGGQQGPGLSGIQGLTRVLDRRRIITNGIASRHSERMSFLMGVQVVSKLNTLSLLAVTTCSLFVFWGCDVQMDEATPAEVSESEVGEVKQGLTTCGQLCPSGYHPTQYSCSYTTCGSSCYGPGNSNQVTCMPDSGTFTSCGSSCPSGWHPTQYSCTYSYCGSPCYGPGNSNQVGCERDCDPRTGTHGQTWVDTFANTYYVYRDGWCSVGSSLPQMCYEGTYYYSQYLVSQYCQRTGSGGSCYDNDALWGVTCKSLVDCIYNCSGQCVKADC
jgi:hypothetical protein